MTEAPRTLYIILARGGSKRLPGKNLLEVGAVPLVGRSVRKCLHASRILGTPSRITVSTDSHEIAETAREWGAEIPFIRPKSLAADETTSVEAMRHTLEHYSDSGEHFSEIVLVPPTSPLSTGADIVRAITTFRKSPQRSVVSVRPTSGEDCPFLYGLEEGVIVNADDVTDELKVELNGAVYVCSPNWLAEHDSLCVPKLSIGSLMPAERSVDVDTLNDLNHAQTLWRENVPWTNDKCLIIAEAGVNHNGSVARAIHMIDAAVDARADAIKFQTFSAERLATRHAAKADYQKEGLPDEETQLDMLKRLELSPADHEMLSDYCLKRGITFLSSAFSSEDVDLLVELNVPAIKLGSAEVTNHPLLRHAGSTLCPLILSTGGSTMQEVADAVSVLTDAGCRELALLHCVSSYPAAPYEVNLKAMQSLQHRFNRPIGFSDHTLGIEAACAAVALGACIIEKHFTLDRTLPGPDHAASLEPSELARMIHAIRNVEAALGSATKGPTPAEEDVRQAARRSVVAARDLPESTILSDECLACKRPGTGIAPTHMHQLLGKKTTRELKADEQITWNDID